MININEKKAEITNKESEEYTILCIIGTIVKSFKTYKDESKVSEATYLRKFEQILDELLFPVSLITFYDGESVSRSTKRMKIIKKEESDYGRRIDLIVTSRDDDQQFELSANEFKRNNVSSDLLRHQQSKNIRINACILNDFNLLFNNTTTTVSYFDFQGRYAYMVNLFNFEGCLVAYKSGSFTIPKSLIQLDRFRESLINLYCWNNATLENSQDVLLAIGKEDDDYGFADVACDLPVLCTSPPRHQVVPVEVYFSSFNDKRRIKSVINNDTSIYYNM